MSRKITNPRTRELVTAASLLRSRDASSEEIDRQAWRLYPARNSTDASHRSRLLQLVRTSASDFKKAADAAQANSNLREVMALIPPRTAGGAPLGNTNAFGKRKRSTVSRLSELWALSSPDDRIEFLTLHALQPKKA